MPVHAASACQRLHRLLAGLVLTGAAACHGATGPALAPATAQPMRVVILMGVDPAQPALRQFDDAFRRTLQAGSPAGVTFFTDTLDTLRFPYARIAPEFLVLERKKYADQRVDLVVGIGDGVVEFIRDHASQLWPGAPVVLSGIDEGVVDRSRLPPGAAALLWRPDIEGTLSIIEKLQPGAKRLIVVGGSTEFDLDATRRTAARAAERPRWKTETWNNFSIEDLRSRLSALDPTSAVLYTSMYRDGNGRATFPVDALADIAEGSGAPIYGLYRTYLGRGAAAGSIVDFATSGRQAAELATALLKGQAVPASLPLAPVRCVADFTRLQAHGLRTSDLPVGCELLNPPRNLWNEYRGFVLAATAVVLLQSLTIGALLLQRRRRQFAEAEALQRRTELSRAMRFAAIGELTASIAHEINQPLGAILSNADAAEMLLKNGTATLEDLREILADIRRDDLRARDVIRRLRALLERHEVEHRPMRLHATFDEVLALLTPDAKRRGVTLERAFDATDDRLLGDPVQLQQVLLNLALNAMDAMEHTPPVSRLLRIAITGHGDRLEIEVADRGCGIDASRHAAVFESFHTTKPHGLGLGLPIVRAIVEAHQGRIVVSARDGDGAVFTVTLPRRLEPAPALDPQTAAPALFEGAR